MMIRGSLIENAEELLDKDVHPTIVVEGFREASKKTIEFLKEISIEISPKDKIFLDKIAKTTIASKLVTTNSELLSKLVIDAALRVADEMGENKFKIDLDDIKVDKKAGGSLQDSQLIQGMVIDKEVVHAGMPKRIQAAKIALINSALEIEKTEFDAKLNINSPEQMQKFLSEEGRMLKSGKTCKGHRCKDNY
jgi:chaperonin GroEL (HSP60 family)